MASDCVTKPEHSMHAEIRSQLRKNAEFQSVFESIKAAVAKARAEKEAAAAKARADEEAAAQHANAESEPAHKEVPGEVDADEAPLNGVPDEADGVGDQPDADEDEDEAEAAHGDAVTCRTSGAVAEPVASDCCRCFAEQCSRTCGGRGSPSGVRVKPGGTA